MAEVFVFWANMGARGINVCANARVRFFRRMQCGLKKPVKLTPAAAKLKPAASEVVAPSITNPVDPSRSAMPNTAGKVAAPNTTRISPAAEEAPHAPTITSSNPSPLISCMAEQEVWFATRFSSWRGKTLPRSSTRRYEGGTVERYQFFLFFGALFSHPQGFLGTNRTGGGYCRRNAEAGGGNGTMEVLSTKYFLSRRLCTRRYHKRDSHIKRERLVWCVHESQLVVSR